jgi:hypothetical protein
MLVALLVVPATAQPSLSVDLVRDGGGLPVLSAAGNWQWEINVVGDDAFDSSLAVEIGIQLDTLTTLTPGDTATIWDTPNPGEAVGGLAGAFDYLAEGARAGNGFEVIGNEAYISVGSSVITDFSSPILLATLEAGTPSVPDAATPTTTSIDILGAWASATTTGTSALVAQEISAGNIMSAVFSDSQTKSARGGDANLDGNVSIADFATLQNNFNMGAGRIWSDGDFNATGDVTISDFAIFQNNYPNSFPPAPGSGSGSSAVPEPTSALLVLLGMVAAMIARSRK